MRRQVKTTLGDGVLTTEHSASSYGQAVLVLAGEVYGPGDLDVTILAEPGEDVWALADELEHWHVSRAWRAIVDGEPVGQVLGVDEYSAQVAAMHHYGPARSIEVQPIGGDA